MANYRAKYNSCGFRKRFWFKNEIAYNVTKEESLLSEIKHFILIENKTDESNKTTIEEVIETKESISDSEGTLALAAYQQAYREKFSKEVPPRFKNDMAWIKDKLKGDNA